MHGLAEQFLKSKMAGDVGGFVELQKKFDSFEWPTVGFRDGYQESLYKAKGRLQLSQFYEQFLGVTPPVFVEKEFTLDIDAHKLIGRIDLVLPQEDDTVFVIDFKTGSLKAKKRWIEICNFLYTPGYVQKF